MTPISYTLRAPSALEVQFYDELREPLGAFIALRLQAPDRIRQATLLAQRFKKDIVRYGYVLTERGLMMQVEPDIVESKLNAAHRAMLALDMQIISRLTDNH